MCDKASFRPVHHNRLPIIDGEALVQYYRINNIQLMDLRTKLFDYAIALEHGDQEKAAQLFKAMQRTLDDVRGNEIT